MVEGKLTIPILATSCVLVMLLALNDIGSAFAGGGCNESHAICTGTSTATFDLVDDPLSLTTNDPSFSNYTLGDATLPNSTLPISVNDGRGTGAGWTVSITMTQFKGPESSNLNTLPEENVASFTAMSPACAGNSTCTLPGGSSCSISPTLVVTMNGSTSTQLCDSGTNAGKGEIALNPKLTLAIPFNTVPDTYSSTITVTVTSDS
ncbi:MAG: WxL domain-containing protein [Ktedonobacteraceae bacterium]